MWNHHSVGERCCLFNLRCIWEKKSFCLFQLTEPSIENKLSCPIHLFDNTAEGYTVLSWGLGMTLKQLKSTSLLGVNQLKTRQQTVTSLAHSKVPP